ncbi:MAG TPA: pitrilysin family protein [Chitinophagaceae bacterium]|nr:pitrilysin family protein [Chitinophagaceae bacterium]
MNSNTISTAVNRAVAPYIKDAIEFDLHLKPYEKLVLKNGAEVYAINAGAEEVLQVEWVFFAGNSYEEQNIVAAATNYLLKNGTSQKNAFAINEHFEYYGASLNRNCYNETAVLSLHCLTRHIGELLPVVRELLTDSVMPEEELELFKQNRKQRLQVNLKKSEFVAGRLVDACLYGEQHPYGKYSREEDYDRIDRQQLLDFYNSYYRQGKFIMFIAGKLPANLEQLLNDNFGDLATGAVPLKTMAAAPSAEKKFRVINDEAGVQGSIRIATPFPNRHHPDFQKVMVLNTLFGGFFGSRLMSNIREDKGYTYGIHSYLQNHIQQSAWLVSTEAGRDVCEATIAEIYKEMALLREMPVDEEELLLVKNFLVGTVLGDLDGPFHIIARWKNLILNGLDGSYFDQSVQTIKTITAKELQELANKYLVPDNFYELVVI